jgi:hypothetical protein
MSWLMFVDRATPCIRFGEGMEAENAAALGRSDPSVSAYNRRTRQPTIALQNFIGNIFSVKTLQSIVRDIGNWVNPKIGRDVIPGMILVPNRRQ